MSVTVNSALDAVREKLTEHAERGLFRSLHEIAGRNGQVTFRFVWLVDDPFELVVDPERSMLRFRDLLPGLPAGSDDYRAVRTFVHDRMHPELRPHRRIDPERAVVSCSTRGGKVTITLSLVNGDVAYGLEKLLNLANELFGELQLRRPEYMIEEFGASEE